MNKRDIVIKSTTYLRGPNIWTYCAIIEAVVDIGDLEDSPSNTVPGLYERLTTWLPSLVEHRCSPGVHGGFLMRLKEGTWPCHILEHVTLALQDLAGVPGYGFGRARETEERGVYKVMVSGWEEKVTLAALYMGRDLVMAAIDDLAYDLEGELDKLKDLAQDLCLGPSTASMVLAADERTIPAIRLSEGNLVQFGYGAKQRRIWTAETDQTSAIAETISRDKGLTKQLLETCGVPIPTGRAVESAADAWEAALDLGLPVVVKPVDGNHGRGVFINLESRTEIEAAYDVAVDEGSGVLIEKFIRGNEHRLLIVGGKLAAAAKGRTASVVGDGQQTVQELITSQINSDPRRGRGEDQPLNPVRIDSAARLELTRQGFNGDSVVPAGKEVLIQRNGNVAFDCTDDVHPEVIAIAALAAQAVGLDIAGIDLVAEDISKPLSAQGGAIVEVNAGPGLLMHLKPAEGLSRPVGRAIIDHIFPGDENGSIPLVGVTGSTGTGNIARLTAHLLNAHGWRTGLANTDGLYVGTRRLFAGDAANWDQARRLLLNREVQAAVIENNGMEILTKGLAYDRCSVGVVTNVVYSETFKNPEVAFHAFETAEDLIKVYRSQVDVVWPHGVGVLNADDPHVASMAQYCDGSIIFYSPSCDSLVIAAHLAEGKRAVFIDQNIVITADAASQQKLISLTELSAYADPQNTEARRELLAAVATTWALGIPSETIRNGLRSFK
ncbi:cyanophycin synthetase [Burkholderiaceae bacterium]